LKGTHTQLKILLRRGPKTMWLNAMKETGSECFRDLKESSVPAGIRVGLGFRKEAALSWVWKVE